MLNLTLRNRSVISYIIKNQLPGIHWYDTHSVLVKRCAVNSTRIQNRTAIRQNLPCKKAITYFSTFYFHPIAGSSALVISDVTKGDLLGTAKYGLVTRQTSNKSSQSLY